MTGDRAGLMIIRAWVEHGSSEPLRVQIRRTTDVAAGLQRTVTLVRADAVAAAVQEWLAAMLSEPPRSE